MLDIWTTILLNYQWDSFIYALICLPNIYGPPSTLQMWAKHWKVKQNNLPCPQEALSTVQ